MYIHTNFPLQCCGAVGVVSIEAWLVSLPQVLTYLDDLRAEALSLLHRLMVLPLQLWKVENTMQL